MFKIITSSNSGSKQHKLKMITSLSNNQQKHNHGEYLNSQNINGYFRLNIIVDI